LLNPKFLLDISLFNPDRMQLKEIEAYWNHWVSLAEAEASFSFLSRDEGQGNGDDGNEGMDGAGGENDGNEGGNNEDQGGNNGDQGEKSDGGDDEANKEPPTHSALFGVDEGIPLPSTCKTTAERTKCLLSLAPDGELGRILLNLINLVDGIEVSLILVIQSSL